MIAKVWRFLKKASMMEFLSKIECLQCSDCNSSIKRLHHRFSPEYVSTSSCQEEYFEKKVNHGKCFNKVEALQYKPRNFIKNRAKQSSC